MKGIRNFKSLLWSVVLMGIFCSVGFGQEWKKVINHGVTNDAYSICQTKDSAYWITGHSDYDNLALTKLDINGIEIFHKIYQGRGMGINVSPTLDNGVLLVDAGRYNTNNNFGKFSKIDKSGNILWEYKAKDLYDAKEITNQNVLYLSTDSLGVLDNNGKLLWKKMIPDSVSYARIILINNNSFLVSGVLRNTRILKEYHYDYDGNLLSEKEIFKLVGNNTWDFQRNSDASYIILSNLIDANGDNHESNIFKVQNQQLIWKKMIGETKGTLNTLIVTNFIIDKNKNIVLVGTDVYGGSTGSESKSLAFVMVLDNYGNFRSLERFGEQYINDFTGITESNDGYYVACGWHNVITGIVTPYPAWVVKTKAAALSKSIFGKVIIDNNNNCKVDSLENNIKGWSIVAEHTNKPKNYAFVDNNGNYSILTDSGTYNLKINIPSPYYSQICNSTVSIADSVNSKQLDLFLQKNMNCPYLNVNITNRALRPCFDAVQVVNFCNHGSAIAQNAYIEVQLDANLTYQSSTKTAIPKGNNLYRFDLGNIPIDSCGQFTISTKVACDNSLLGKTLCNSAHIFPDSLCAPQDNGKIQVTGTCNGSTIDFKIKNLDDKPMNNSKQYIVIEDHVMFRQGSFNLTPNQVETVSIPAQAGKTYRIIAEQTNPIYGNLATIAFENCNVSASPTTGMINQFPQGDDSPFEDTDCRVVTASYDPNDKQAVPEGVNNQHFIAKNTDLEYMIRFQNKGTDTAFLVIIKDTLSQFLDPATIELGASSHPCKFDLTDRGIAKFIFSGINLPHEKVDKEGSNGFVKFRIKQRRDLPNGTVINNKAAIFFDYNDPIITNTTYHTIGENWLMIVPNKEVNEATIDITVFPNPFNESTRIEAQIGEEHNNLTFNLFNSNGQILRSESFVGKTLDFQRNGLHNGFYFYEIKSDGKRLGTGKLVVF